MGLTNLSRTRKSWSFDKNPPVHWWVIPEVKQRWNKIITGNPLTEYPEYVLKKYFSDRQNITLLSPACGTGTKEIRFASFEQINRIDAFDLSPIRIKAAQATAENSGFKKINYFVASMYTVDLNNNEYDIIMFDSSLHHFERLDKLIHRIKAALKPKGLLVINEFTGPNRFQWSKSQLKISNQLLKTLPVKYRKRWNSSHIKNKIHRPGILRMYLSDPSESIKSQTILPAIHKHLTVLEEKKIGGNILNLLFKDISHNFVNEIPETKKLLNRLFTEEDDFLSKTGNSDFVFGIYQK